MNCSLYRQGMGFANGKNALMLFFKPYPLVFAGRLRYIIKRMFNVVPSDKFVTLRCAEWPVAQQCQVYWLRAPRRLAGVFVKAIVAEYSSFWPFSQLGWPQALKRAVYAFECREQDHFL